MNKQSSLSKWANSLRNLGVRGKIILATISITATAVAVLVTYFVVDVRTTLYREAQVKLQSFSQVKGNEVEEYFGDLRTHLVNAAEDETIQVALKDLTAGKNKLKAEMAANDAPLDKVVMDRIREENLQYLEKNLVALLKQSGFDGKQGILSALDYLPKTDEGNLLIYFYIVSNPSPLGKKAERNSIQDLLNRTVPEKLRVAFTKTSYAAAHQRTDEVLQKRSERLSADLHIVSADGFVLYTTSKQLDFGGDVATGADKDQGLGKAHNLALAAPASEKAEDMIRNTDYEPFSKALGVPSSFISCGILSENRQTVGTFTIEVPSDHVYNILSHNNRHELVGLGKSGENYLVGKDGFARSNSRFISDLKPGQKKKYIEEDGKTEFESTINKLEVKTEAWRKVMAGVDSEGAGVYPDYRGIPVLGSYRKLNLGGLDYMIMSEIDEAEVFAPINRKIYLALGLALLILAVGCAISFVLGNKLARPVIALSDAAEKISAGDNSARAPVISKDEIGHLATTFNAMVAARIEVQQKTEQEYKRLQEGIQSLLLVTSDASDGDFTVRAKVTEGALGNVADAMNLMFENVSDTLKEVQAAATRVASAAMEIQASSEQLAQGSVQQTSEIVNTTSAVQEMAANIESVSNNANAAADAATRAKTAADEGAKSVAQVIEGMQRIRENVQGGAKKIKRLGERSMEISSIVNTISEISAQTDMLALNAAIEAARAGEHGRGFTVVAEEVRKLAERTASATKEIEKLIAGIQAETNESVSSMERQTSEVEQEAKVVAGAGSSLSRIHEASVQSAELINEINLAAKQQVRGANGVVKAMEVVSGIAQQAQSGTGQTKRATETLSNLAGDLTKSLGKFKIAAIRNN